MYFARIISVLGAAGFVWGLFQLAGGDFATAGQIPVSILFRIFAGAGGMLMGLLVAYFYPRLK